MVELSSPEYATVFELLDGYARARHQCFLAELFLSHKEPKYFLCFRPIGMPLNSSNQFSCRYLQISVSEIELTGKDRAIPALVVELLDKELNQMKM